MLSRITRSTKLWDAQCSPELAFRSTDFHVPENLISPALNYQIKIKNKNNLNIFILNLVLPETVQASLCMVLQFVIEPVILISFLGNLCRKMKKQKKWNKSKTNSFENVIIHFQRNRVWTKCQTLDKVWCKNSNVQYKVTWQSWPTCFWKNTHINDMKHGISLSALNIVLLFYSSLL